MFGQIYFRVLGIGCFLSMALLSSAQSKLDSLHHLNEVVVTARINKEVIQVTFFNRLIINYLHNCIAYNMPTFLVYYRLFLT